MIDPGESALAVVGLSPVIRGEMPIFGVERLREANAIPETIASEAKTLANEPPEMPALARPHAYKALLERLATPLTPAETVAISGRFKPPAEDVAGPFLVKVQQAFEHARTLFPVSTYSTFAGSTQLEPTADRVWRFFLELQVIDDPLLVIPLAAAGGLLAVQVAAVREMYPTISGDPDNPEPGTIDSAIYQALATARAAKKSFRLSPRTEYGLAVWFGRRTVDYQPPKPTTPPSPDLGAKPASQVAKGLTSPAENAGQIAPPPVER